MHNFKAFCLFSNYMHKDVSDEKCKDSNGKRETPPQGICGSGIIDLIAELFLEGWIDIRGKLSPEKSLLIQE